MVTKKKTTRKGSTAKASPDAKLDKARLKAAEDLGKDLLEILVSEFKVQPDIWAKLTKEQQDDAIDRCRKRLAPIGARTLDLIAGKQFKSLAAEVGPVTFNDGCKIVLKAEACEKALHLASIQGSKVLVVMADPKEYLGSGDSVEGEENQKDFIDEEKKEANRKKLAEALDKAGKGSSKKKTTKKKVTKKKAARKKKAGTK